MWKLCISCHVKTLPCDKIQVIVNLFFILGKDTKISDLLTCPPQSVRPGGFGKN